MPTPRLMPFPAATRSKESAWLTPPLAATTAMSPAGICPAAGTKLAVRPR